MSRAGDRANWLKFVIPAHRRTLSKSITRIMTSIHQTVLSPRTAGSSGLFGIGWRKNEMMDFQSRVARTAGWPAIEAIPFMLLWKKDE